MCTKLYYNYVHVKQQNIPILVLKHVGEKDGELVYKSLIYGDNEDPQKFGVVYSDPNFHDSKIEEGKWHSHDLEEGMWNSFRLNSKNFQLLEESVQNGDFVPLEMEGYEIKICVGQIPAESPYVVGIVGSLSKTINGVEGLGSKEIKLLSPVTSYEEAIRIIERAG